MSSLVQATPPPLDDRTFPLDVLGDGGVVIKKLSKRGRLAEEGDHVQVNYVGRVKGKEDEFDRNHGGYPFEFTVGAGKVVKGWDEAIKVLKVGDAVVELAPDYGYGAEGSEDDVPPGATLVFDMELARAAAAEKKATIAAKAGAKSALAEKLANKNKKGGGKKEKKEWKPPEKKEKPAKAAKGKKGKAAAAASEATTPPPSP
ncbi:FK506 binding protein [Aureococcus anophagefferens]|nr:FK506 binding protein [Aureococcus anophagefferens]